MTSHYITLHYIMLHYIILHFIILHYKILRYITVHYITLHHMLLVTFAIQRNLCCNGENVFSFLKSCMWCSRPNSLGHERCHTLTQLYLYEWTGRYCSSIRWKWAYHSVIPWPPSFISYVDLVDWILCPSNLENFVFNDTPSWFQIRLSDMKVLYKKEEQQDRLSTSAAQCWLAGNRSVP